MSDSTNTVNDRKAGAELDGQVAEQVMGWTRIDPEVSYGSVWGIRPGGDGTDKYPVPHYSTDIAAAWEVVQHFAGPARDKRCVIIAITEPDEWACTIGGDDDAPPDKEEFVGVADTAPLAICRAALAAAGTEVA